MARMGLLPSLIVLSCMIHLLPDVAGQSASMGQARRLRVRKEMRNLSPDEMRLWISGLATMMSVATDAGKNLFGPKYKELDYFVVKHELLSLIPFNNAALGNIAHFGPWFMTFHRAFNLEFENSLLSVVPELLAMPYWEFADDLATGKYYQTDQWMYGPNYAGSVVGDPEYDYMVVDGLFAGKQINKFNFAKYGEFANMYTGNVGGWLRSMDNNLESIYITRFSSANLGPPTPKPWPPQWGDFPYYYEIDKQLSINYTSNEVLRCIDTNNVFSSWDFIMCIEFPTTILQRNLSDTIRNKWLNEQFTSPWTHAMFHSITGGIAAHGQLGIQGDARDLGSSPNEALMFFADHANLDRYYLMWQTAINRIDPTQSTPDVLWGYPKQVIASVPPGSLTQTVLPGCSLDDEIASIMPFTDIFPWPTPNGVTHRDILMWNPDYTYDNMHPPEPQPYPQPASG